MKKIFALVLAFMFIFVGCSKNTTEPTKEANTTENTQNTENTDNADKGLKEIETLSIQFVPSREPDQIVTQTEPLKGILKEELKNFGYDVKNVEISVGTSYEATGEALASGTVDIGLIPGGTYVLYDDGAEVILTSTRKGLNVESDSAVEWNKNKPSYNTEDQVTFYRSLIIAGPSPKGRELAEKVNNGEELTWEDLNSAKWSVMGASSSSGYIYPYLYLQKNFDHKLTDLQSATQADSYGSSMARLASEQVDIMVCYADARMDNVEKWTSEFGREKSIWDETDVIGVSDRIYNDTISVSKKSPIMDDELKEALTQAFINIAQTEEGKQIIKIYNHTGYQRAQSSDYDGEREAQKLLKSLKN